jgi:DNA polymerase III beta subunit-like protein
MKLTIERAALLKALSHVQSVVERRTTIPILSNVLLQAAAGTLSMSATDMDLEIVESVPARIEGEGRTTAPAHTLYDIVRKLRDGAQVELETIGERNEMVLRSGRSTFTLSCLPPEDYPVMTGAELPHHFTLTAGELRTLIDRTRFAISTEETRYYLNGIYLHATKNNEVPVLRSVATDGHRLARVEMVLPEGAAGMPGVIVPRKTVLELRKLIEEGDDEVQVALGDTKIRCAIDRTQQGGETRRRPRQPYRLRDEPRKRHGDRGNGGSLPGFGDRDRVQFTLPARHRGADRGRSGAVRDVRCGIPHDRPRQRRRKRALRVDADAGLIRKIARIVRLLGWFSGFPHPI